MASPEAAIIAALKANAGVSALAGDRIILWGAKQGLTYPYVTVQRATTQGAGHLAGPSSLDWPLLQIDVWGSEALSALATAEAIRTAIDSLTVTAAGLTITAVFQDQRGPAPDEETRNFRVSQDYHVFHQRS